MNLVKLRVLCLDDIIEDANLIRETLKNDGLNLEFDIVTDEVNYSKELRSKEYDIILSDYNLPGFSGIAALLLAKKLCPLVPFICVSGTIGEDLAVEMMHLGASDYIIKDKLSKLPIAVNRALNEAEEHRIRLYAERSLAESEARFKDIIMSSNDWVWEIDKEWKYCYSSEKIEIILGYSPEEMMGKTPFDFMTPEEQNSVGSVFTECVRKKSIIKDLENWNIHKNGHLVCLLTNGIPVLDKEGNLVGYRGADKDITKRKNLEAELLESKVRAEASDNLKTAFLNNISHEVRTPLNGILGFAEFVLQPDLQQEEKDSYLRILNESSDRLVNTITNYMDISLIVSGNMNVKSTQINVNKILEKIYNLFLPRCKTKGLNLFTHFQNGITPQIMGDEGLLVKAISHLLDNAVKFTSTGTITIGYNIVDKTLEIFIKDTGKGIDPESQNAIFNIFMQGEVSNTRGYEGSGLGLSIARGIMELLGGKMSLESEKGKGSVFFMQFNYENINEVVQLVQNKGINILSDSKSLLVLIVEDDESNANLMKVLFSKHALKFIIASNGKEAVDICISNPDISLILMDIKMPVMNGLVATRKIKEFRKDLPIIGLTAFAMTGDKEKALEAGCVDYLTKPVRSEQLFSLINRYINK